MVDESFSCRALSILRLLLGSSNAACGEVDGLYVWLLGLLYWIPGCVEHETVWGSGISTFGGVCCWCEGFGLRLILKRLREEHDSILFGEFSAYIQTAQSSSLLPLASVYTRLNHAMHVARWSSSQTEASILRGRHRAYHSS